MMESSGEIMSSPRHKGDNERDIEADMPPSQELNISFFTACSSLLLWCNLGHLT